MIYRDDYKSDLGFCSTNNSFGLVYKEADSDDQVFLRWKGT